MGGRRLLGWTTLAVAMFGVGQAVAQTVDGAYSVTLTLVDGFSSPCNTMPNAERTMTITSGTVSMPLSPRGRSLEGTTSSDGTITATTRSPASGSVMTLTAKLEGSKLTGQIVGPGGCRFELTGALRP
jgi:hypothetical protein